MTDINGTLRNARRVAGCLKGYIFGDTKGRFLDGDLIRTSSILSEDADVFKTRNSVYKVETWAGEVQP